MQSPPRPLLMLACSGMKLAAPAPALELYRGVMYQTYRANVRAGAEPHIVILSALHGFLNPETIIAPYDQRMTGARADEMLAHLVSRYMVGASWPRELGNVFLAGGAEYRRVMRAALDALRDCYGIEAIAIAETRGGIGEQRAQLGAFLRAA